MKCKWPGCNGLITQDNRCLMCGRSTDLDYEKQVYDLQTKRKHHNWHSKIDNSEEYSIFRKR